LLEELDELFDEEFELELLDEFELEFDELLPATMMEPSSWLVTWAGLRSMSSGAVGYSLACAAVAANAAMPAARAELSVQYRVMAVTPFFRLDRWVPVRRSNGRPDVLFPSDPMEWLASSFFCASLRRALRALGLFRRFHRASASIARR
jgi:hypothetical protein